MGISSLEMWVAHRQRCLAFVVFGGRPSVREREEGRGKSEERDLSENVGRESFHA
jgi:hypothetical protein